MTSNPVSKLSPEKCEHYNFETSCAIGRITSVEGGPVAYFVAEIRIKCRDCGAQFQFHGLPLGLSAYRPTVSIDGFELRAPIMPEGSKIPTGIAGFSVAMPDTPDEAP
ncbi:MAG: hypothetical protein AAFQ67_02250 [Pseudomonadota bacterium]